MFLFYTLTSVDQHLNRDWIPSVYTQALAHATVGWDCLNHKSKFQFRIEIYRSCVVKKIQPFYALRPRMDGNKVFFFIIQWPALLYIVKEVWFLVEWFHPVKILQPIFETSSIKRVQKDSRRSSQIRVSLLVDSFVCSEVGWNLTHLFWRRKGQEKNFISVQIPQDATRNLREKSELWYNK